MNKPDIVILGAGLMGRVAAYFFAHHPDGPIDVRLADKDGAMLRAAAEAARALGPHAPKIVAVTVLTSLDQQDLADVGVQRTPADQALALARLALAAGVDGLVCSPQEAAALRKEFGSHPLLVTPGIRLPADVLGDQKRVATPAAAVRAGASFLVVGRPILEAADPAAAVQLVLRDMAAA